MTDTTISYRRLFVTLRSDHDNGEVDLEMPGDRPIKHLLPDLIKSLGWPTTDGNLPLRYHLTTESGDPLSENTTLASAGVKNSDVVRIALEDLGGAATGKKNRRKSGAAEEVTSSASPQTSRDDLAPPIQVQIHVTAPSLVSEEAGVIFILGKPPVVIGRAVGDAKPNIDLTKWDAKRAVSRTHAKIVLEKNQYALVPEPTKNGTWVEGEKIPAGEARSLRDGDKIQFGFNGVTLIFRSPPAS